MVKLQVLFYIVQSCVLALRFWMSKSFIYCDEIRG